MTHVDANVGKTGVEKGFHFLLDCVGQGLPAAAGLETEMGREGEAIVDMRLNRRWGRALRQDRLG